MSLLIAIPVKPFGVAKARLAPVLDAHGRFLLGRAVAGHVLGAAQSTGHRVAVVTADAGVARWARRLGADVVGEPPGLQPGLNRAAAAVTQAADAAGQDWMGLHADLPHLAPADLEAALHRFRPGRYVIAPSYDGGTTLMLGTGSFPFSYGPGSFHRHLRAAGTGGDVVVRRGLALDLDSPRDLVVASRRGVVPAWQGAPA